MNKFINFIKTHRLLIFVGFFIVFICVFLLVSIISINSNTYKSNDESAFKGNDKVTVSKDNNNYFFDGPGTDSLIIFYQDSYVDYKAYADLMLQISEHGTDCILVKSFLTFASLSTNNINSIIKKYNYKSYYVCGHGNGGIAVAKYAIKNTDKLSGVILLGSYSKVDLSNSGLKVLSIYGSYDTVLDMDKYQELESNLPEGYSHSVLASGNHTGFATIDLISGDTESAISGATQRMMTASMIATFISK